MTMRKSFITKLCFIILLISLVGCGGSNSSLSSGNTGSIAAQLDWSKSSSGIHTASAPAGVVTVRIIVSGPDMADIQKDFPASDGQGVIDGVPVGSDRTVTAQGLDSSGNVTHQGSIGNITVTAGQTTDVGTIVMLPSVTLNSIAVTPANPSITIGATQQFAATGTYSDGTIADITTQVTWTSSNTAVATVNISGLAIGIAAGTATITASSGTVMGSAVLAVTSTSLPSGFPANVPTGNYDVTVQVCVSGFCQSGVGFTTINTDINLFAQQLIDALNAAAAQQQTSCNQSGVSCSFNVSYTPWNGTSFTIIDSFTVTSGNVTESGTITFTVTKV